MNKKIYQTAGKKKAIDKDAQQGEVIPKDQVWENGKIVKIVKTGAKTQRVVIGVYYVDDNGKKVKGLKPVKGTIPRKKSKKSGGIMQYKYGGPKMYQEAGVNEEMEDPRSIATRNVNSDLFEPNFNLNADIAGNVGGKINFNPRLGIGPDRNLSFNDQSRLTLGPNFTHSSTMGFKNKGQDYFGQHRNTLGGRFSMQSPIGNRGMIGGISGEAGSLLKGSNQNGDMINNLMGDYNAYGQVGAGLGYYPKNKNFGLKGNISYGSEKSNMPGLNYGATANYGPVTFNINKGRHGVGGGFGLGLPIGGPTQRQNKQKGGMYDQSNAYEHGGVKDPNAGITALRKVAPNVVKTMGYGMGGMMKNYQVGGMYGPNTMSAAGQGNPQLGMSSTIVGQETDPALQEARMQGLEQSGQGLSTEAESLARQTRQQESIDKQRADQEAMIEEQQYQQQNAAIGSAVNRAGQFIGNRVAGNAPGPGSFGEAFNIGKNAYNLTKAANMANDASQVSQAAQLASDAGGFIGSSADAAQAGNVIMDASGNIVNAGSAVGNAANSAMSAMPWGTIANYAGKGITALSDDDDPTKSNAGEYAGNIVSRAGQGATLGSFFPGPGTAIGAGVGAVVGGVEQLVGTNKARRAKQEYESEARTARNEGIYDLNARVGNLYGSHMSNVAAGNLAQKTMSGQNLGRNVMYQQGGKRAPKRLNRMMDTAQNFSGSSNLSDRIDVPFALSGQKFPAIPSEAHSQMMQNKITSADITSYGLKPNHPLAGKLTEEQTMNKMNQIQNFQKSQLTYKHGGRKGMMMKMPRYGYNS